MTDAEIRLAAVAHLLASFRRRIGAVALPAELERAFRLCEGQTGSPLAGRSSDVDAVCVTYESAAAALSVSVSTVKRLSRSGALRVVEVGGAPRVRVADLVEFAAALPVREA